jgi:sarcosine oxidase, subunit alpha
MQPPVQYRLPPEVGQILDRGKPLKFTFEGRRYAGYAGDTVASALAANGVTMLSRSFKYHRPRGIVSLGGCEANTLVEVNGVPNVLAERHSLKNGDCIRAQNYSGSLAFDWNAWMGAVGRFFPVGFYYRAFFRPKGAWRFWEPIIRRMAGLGRVDTSAHHGYYDKAYLFADVAVVGGGAAGLSAAIAAAKEENRVVIVDDNPVLGGALNYARYDDQGIRSKKERDALISRLTALPQVTILSGATCEGLFAENWLAVVQSRRLYKLRAGRVVLATGAIEQPIIFRNNDLPGVMYGSAAQRLIRLYGVRPGRRAIVLTANDFGYGVALDLLDANVSVAAIIDLRMHRFEGALRSAVIERGTRIESATTITEALGRRHVRGVRIARLRPNGSHDDVVEIIDCDLVCTSGGFAPNLALTGHVGAQLVYDLQTAMHRPEGLPKGLTVAGAANQLFSLDAVLADGWQAGCFDRAEPSAPPIDASASEVSHPWPFFAHPKGKEFVDFDEDLTIKDIFDSVASGFDDIQLLKRYSTAGMGPSQGRHSAVNTIRLAARARAADEADIGTTTARPPYSGESFGVLAGRSFDPVRRTAMHHRHLEVGAQMMPAGAWMRPAYYGTKGNATEAIASEVAAVRSKSGLIDVSTLGKIEIRGPDAAEFLNRIYFTGHLKQPVGRARYALMTDAAGAITDDGVICRLADAHFFVTATTSGVEAVVRSMYFWNAQWQLDIDIAHVSAAYAAVNLAGPDSRSILAELCKDIDLRTDAFPYMGVRTGHVADIPVRILRVGFVGELGYEIHVPAGCGEFLWDRLLETGHRWGLRPFGVSAQRVLRLEKGHIIVGQDTDGLTNPLEIGMGSGSTSKPFFIGDVALAAHRQRSLERKLAGFQIEDGGALPKECHLVIEGSEIAGRVTSCVRSAAVGHVIGLAYVRPHQAKPGQAITIRVERGKLVTARIVPLPFYDPGNQRQQA